MVYWWVFRDDIQTEVESHTLALSIVFPSNMSPSQESNAQMYFTCVCTVTKLSCLSYLFQVLGFRLVRLPRVIKLKANPHRSMSSMVSPSVTIELILRRNMCICLTVLALKRANRRFLCCYVVFYVILHKRPARSPLKLVVRLSLLSSCWTSTFLNRAWCYHGGAQMDLNGFSQCDPSKLWVTESHGNSVKPHCSDSQFLRQSRPPPSHATKTQSYHILVFRAATGNRTCSERLSFVFEVYAAFIIMFDVSLGPKRGLRRCPWSRPAACPHFLNLARPEIQLSYGEPA